jgi:hypothetical protein
MRERELVHHAAERTNYVRSTKSKPLKFEASMCDRCNNQRSQPHDNAYDRFISWVLENEQQVWSDRCIDLPAALGTNWEDEALNLLRFWVKHICCRVHEANPTDFSKLIPPDTIPFLDGGALPRSFSFELWVEPAWLRFCEYGGADDPLWVRPLLYDHLFSSATPAASGITQSVWRYGWLSMGWVYGDGVSPLNPVAVPRAPLPFRAQLSASFELAFAGLGRGHRHADASDEQVEARLTSITGGGPVDPDSILPDSPVAEAFVGGALDFEAGVRSRAPDRRDPPQPEVEGFDLNAEVVRASILGMIAGRVWAHGTLDPQHVLAAHAPPVLWPHDLKIEAEQLHSQRLDGDGYDALANDFAALSLLKLAEAALVGYDPKSSENALDGQNALLDAARLSGMAAAATGLGDNLDPLWDSLDAACSRLARIG